MAKVIGLGGVFFKVENADDLRAWYRRVLGFEIESWGGAAFPALGRGAAIWSPFPADSNYFAPSQATFMINLMVDDLDGVLERAKTEGVEPLSRDDSDPNGRFAWLLDPAGLKIELWEPKAA